MCIHAAIKYPSSQFQTGLEQNQVTELLVTILQQFSTHVRIQVSPSNYSSAFLGPWFQQWFTCICIHTPSIKAGIIGSDLF